MELVRKLQGPSFEKTASKFMLGDNPSTYPSELLAHLYKQHSYLGKYKINMSIEGQDDSLGYMYGVFTVEHAPDVPVGPGTERMGEMIRQPEAPQTDEEKKNSLRIPIIVESKKAYSFDVFISPDGRFLPLNEERVSSALFDMNPYVPAPNPEGANPAMQPADPAGVSGGQSTGLNSTVKQASVLDAISSQIEFSAVEEFLHKVAGDQSLKNALKLNGAFGEVIVKLANSAKSQTTPSAQEPKNIDDFDATVFSKVDGGYSMKMASVDGTAQEVFLSNAEAQDIPVEIRQYIIDNGHTLVVPDSNSELVSVEKTASLKIVDSNGVYSVMTKSGNAQRAAVINDVVSLDGRTMDLCLVVGNSGAAFQEKVAGVRCGELNLDSLNGAEPSGDGVFIYKESGVVTEPIDILHKVSEKDDCSYIYDHPLRGKGTIKLANVKKAIFISGNDYLIPETATFVPLTFGGRYSTDEVSMDKIASRSDRMMEVTVHTDGSEFSFSGPPVYGLIKNAGLNSTEALLLLGTLGDTPDGAMKKIASARKKTSISFVAARTLGGQEKVAVDEETIKVAEVINIDLIKEAAALTNSDTVDSVLSLNFVTPENIMGYVDAIPALEDASSKLAELLVGVRLGLSDVPEGAVSSSLRGMERAIQGLKKLQIRANVSLV
tara:strand:- start:1478 stop:3460 length:1983 start_codon:yes stop_codon:yes gene_type:complete